MNETTNGTLGDASASAPVNPLYGTSPAHAAAAAPAASANVDPRAYAASDGSSAGYPIAAVTPAEDDVTRDAVEPEADSWQETLAPAVTPAPEERGKHPGRGTNLLLVATLAAVCGLAGGLAGGAIMSAVSGNGGGTQMAQGGMGGGQQSATAAPGGSGTGSDSDSNSSDGASGNAVPDGQAPSASQDGAAQGDGNGTSAGDGTSSSSGTDSSTGTDSSASQSSTSQTALSA